MVSARMYASSHHKLSTVNMHCARMVQLVLFSIHFPLLSGIGIETFPVQNCGENEYLLEQMDIKSIFHLDSESASVPESYSTR